MSTMSGRKQMGVNDQNLGETRDYSVLMSLSLAPLSIWGFKTVYGLQDTISFSTGYMIESFKILVLLVSSVQCQWDMGLHMLSLIC